jgi:effector-binding domain-containing protein
MDYKFEVVDRPAQPALVIRTRTSVQQLPQVLGQAYGAIMRHAGQLGAVPTGAPFVAYHNMDMEDLEVEIGFPFARALAGSGEVLAGEIPGGKAVTSLHVGPYDQLREAYDALYDWMGTNGHQPGGAAYEFYLNDPQNTPPAELKTQLVQPLKQEGAGSSGSQGSW